MSRIDQDGAFLDSIEGFDTLGSEDQEPEFLADPCKYCGEPIPRSRGIGSFYCSDGCSRSAKREEKKLRNEAAQRRKEIEEVELEESRLDPIAKPLPRQQDLDAAVIQTDFERCVNQRWIVAQSFIEVRKYDGFDLGEWDGDADDPLWVPVAPTREFDPLNQAQLEAKILRSHPGGGHFQIRVYELTAKKPKLRGGPFYFHMQALTPRYGAGAMDPFQQARLDQLEREKKELEKKIEAARNEGLGIQDKMFDLQKTHFERLEKTNEELRRDLMRRDTLAQRQEQQSTHAILGEFRNSMQSAIGQLSNTVNNLVTGGGGGGGFFQRQDNNSAAMLQFMAQQNQGTMEMMIALLSQKGGSDPMLERLLDAAEKRAAALEARLFDVLGGRGVEGGGREPTKIERRLESFQDKLLDKAIDGVLSGGGNEGGSKTLIDRAFDFLETSTVKRLTDSVAKRIEGKPGKGKHDEDEEEYEDDDLPEVEVVSPASSRRSPEPSSDRGRVSPQPSKREIREHREEKPAPKEESKPAKKEATSGGIVDPESVATVEDLLVAVAVWIRDRKDPKEFARRLPEEAKQQIRDQDVKVLINALQKQDSVEEFKTPRARRWIEDAFYSI